MRLLCRSGVGRASQTLPVFLLLAVLAALGMPTTRAFAQSEVAGTQKVIAVAPLRINSATPRSDLESSLPQLLVSRLQARDVFAVISPEETSAALTSIAPEDEAGVRRAAQKLGADYLVLGTLTELAGQFSLDFRLIAAEPGQESPAFSYAAASEDELLGRINEFSETLATRVAQVARVRVSQVVFVGAEELGIDLAEQVHTKAGQDYNGEVARADAERLMTLPEITRATLETESTPDGVVVRFRVLPAQQLFVSPDFDRSMRIVDVVVRGNRRIETAAIMARIRTRPGDAYSQRRIAGDIREIFALRFFKNVTVLREERDGGRVIVFEVEENPVVRQVSILGNDKISADKIRDALTLTTGSSLDYPLLHENVSRIEALYRAEGYYLAKAGFEIEPLTEGTVSVNFEVKEGEKLKLRKIDFEGNQHFTDRQLRRGFKTKPWRFYSFATSFFDKTGTYADAIFLQDLRRVETRYMDDGYVQVHVSEPNVVPHEKGLDVIVKVEEGRQFSVGDIAVRGDETMDLDALHKLVKLKKGKIFNRSQLTADIEALEEHYTDRGYYFAKVNPRTDLKDDADAVSVTFEVEKGSLYFVRQIDFEGNTYTRDKTLRREVQVVEGELYSARKLRQSKERIDRLGYFEEVDIEPRPVEGDEDEVDLGIRVVEKPTGAFSVGIGYSSADSFVFSGSISQANLFGRGYSVQLSADLGGASDRFYFSFSNPYLFDTDWSLGSTIAMTDVEYEDFSQKEQSFALALGHPLDLEFRSRGFLRYSYANQDIQSDDDVEAASILQRQIFDGQQSTSMIGVSFRTDTRNDRLSPTKGMQFGASAEFAGLGGFSRFLRLESKVEWYYPLEWMPLNSTIKLAGRIGYALPFNSVTDWTLPTGEAPTSLYGDFSTYDRQVLALSQIDTDLTLPLSERYFLGGLGTFQLRGYKARSVGPRRATLVQVGDSKYFTPAGIDVTPHVDTSTYPPTIIAPASGDCMRDSGCNDISDRDDSDFEDLDATDVIGGNKFISLTTEYRFTIAESLGLVGILFIDGGNAFAEGDNLFDLGKWRYGTGAGVQWFSPFGPLEAYLGIPLNRLSVEKSMVFEFSMGGNQF